MPQMFDEHAFQNEPAGSDRPVEIRWVKIFTWRANGDGIGLKKNTLVFKDFE